MATNCVKNPIKYKHKKMCVSKIVKISDNMFY